MDTIYFDNASTSFPKAPGVGSAMAALIEGGCYNINRGSYEGAYAIEEIVLETRELLGNLFHFQHTRNILFTPGITYSLNIMLKGLLKSGDHVIVSSMEHNAMMRPLNQLAKLGVQFDAATAQQDGTLDPASVEALIRPNTKAICMLHGSNVCGTLLPIGEIGEICRRRDLLFIVDSAQTGGVFPIDMEAMHIDGLGFAGHKGLRGPQGIGGFLASDALIERLDPLLSGGTGSVSDSEEVPLMTPDRFEPGTMNLPGIIGLHTALTYLKEYTPERILSEELAVTKRFLTGALQLPNTRVVGRHDLADRAAIVSLDFEKRDNAEISFLLENNFGIMTRCGLHCAPRAHKTLHTFPKGTVRFSFSHFNTGDEVDRCLEHLKNLLDT